MKPPGPHAIADRLSTRLIVYFAANPGDELRSDDVMVKFDVPSAEQKYVTPRLRLAVLGGMLRMTRDHRRNVYAAGPKLLQMLAGGR